jgi:hypothetical protein
VGDRDVTWTNWEASREDTDEDSRGGDDLWHVLNFDPGAASSFCFVLDASNSMGEHGRMAAAKKAILDAIAGMKRVDEVALVVFSGEGSARVVQGFTTDKERVGESLKGVRHGGGTDLAGGIRTGGDYLIDAGRFLNKVLVILTDGEETCGGNPQQAAADYRKRVRIEGYGAGGPDRPDAKAPESPRDPAPEPPKEPRREPPAEVPKEPARAPDETPDTEPSEGPVKVKPADRSAYQVEVKGGAEFPAVVVTVTRFWESGRDGRCRVIVSRRKHFVSYMTTPAEPRGAEPGSWKMNAEPFARVRLEKSMATSEMGQAAMDEVRNRWRELPGVPWERAKVQIDAEVNRILAASRARGSERE